MRSLASPPLIGTTADSGIRGISIIIPTYRGGELLRRALESVAAQTLDPKLMEVIVIENGRRGNACGVLDEVSEQRKNLGIEWRYFYSDTPGAGRARNIGLSASTRNFVTFLDDDDWLEAGYLERLYEVATCGTISITGIRNEGKGVAEFSNSLDERVSALPKTAVDAGSIPWALGFNASKLIPRQVLGTQGFSEHLESGEDVVFFAEFLKDPRLRIRVVNDLQGARYVRTVVCDSVSRQAPSFSFSVEQRLDVIQALSVLAVPPAREGALRALMEAQAGFIENYIATNEAEREIVYEAISHRAIRGFPWKRFVRDEAETLVFSYCFPPDVDTSANVMAKRILIDREMVDVISNNMNSVRSQDESFYAVVQRWIGHHHVIDTPTSFSDWNAISAWAEESVRVAQRRKSSYKRLYSRAMWVGSHVAAIRYKSQHPEVHWVAEFSDPLARGADGELRNGLLENNSLAREIVQVIGREKEGRPRTLFEAVEEATLFLADEIIFTNENQKQVILDAYPVSFAEFVERKSHVARQPVPPKFLYSLKPSQHRIDSETINIGYFGAFYPNRGIGNVASAISMLSSSDQQKIRLHVFTSSSLSADEFGTAGERIEVSKYRPYLEFLNLSAEMDVLLVTDTSTTEKYDCNPFLPSKYADYQGAGVPIWGIVEEDSPLSKSELQFITKKDSPAAIAQTLRSIIKTLPC